MRVESAEHKRCPKQCSKKLKERDKNEHFFLIKKRKTLAIVVDTKIGAPQKKRIKIQKKNIMK